MTLRVASQRIYRAAKERSFVRQLNLNKLTSGELQQFERLIDAMAFWPEELSELSPERRLEKLTHAYDSSICSVVVRVFDNKEVQKKIQAEWVKILPSIRPFMDRFVVASYLKILGERAPEFLLSEFQPTNYEILSQAECDMIAVDPSGRVTFSSAIIAQHILGAWLEKEALIGAVVRFANFICDHSKQKTYQPIVRRMLRFWSLAKLLNSKDDPEAVFDRASHIPCVASDPLFWVQYSIAKMEVNDFLAAERYVVTAYAKAKVMGKGFDTYQIDTHSARLSIAVMTTLGWQKETGKKLADAISKLRAVTERRVDDIYHVSKVVVGLFESPVDWRKELSEIEYKQICNELVRIGNAIDFRDDVSFDVESKAKALVESLLR